MNKSILLYSTGCPACNILKNMLKKAEISFDEHTSVEEMLSLGFTKVPVLSVDGINLDYDAAKKWIEENSKGERN